MIPFTGPDMRLGRLLTARIKRILNTGDATGTVPANAARAGLLISAEFQDSTPLVYVVTPDGNFRVNTDEINSRQLLFLLTTHGDLCTKEFLVDDSAALTNRVSMTELFFTAEAIAAYPELIDRY